MSSEPGMNASHANYKELVRIGYNQCAAAYHLARGAEVPSELDVLVNRLVNGASVLDIGCGAGVPVARTLAERFSVTGVDISDSMIELARSNVPAAKFIRADIMSVAFAPSTFDAATAFYSIFHLPRSEHQALFRRIYYWLKPGGYLLCLLPRYNEEAYLDEFFGSTMFWSSYPVEYYTHTLDRIGFDLLEESVTGSGFDESVGAEPESHPLVFARKRKASQ